MILRFVENRLRRDGIIGPIEIRDAWLIVSLVHSCGAEISQETT